MVWRGIKKGKFRSMSEIFCYLSFYEKDDWNRVIE